MSEQRYALRSYFGDEPSGWRNIYGSCTEDIHEREVFFDAKAAREARALDDERYPDVRLVRVGEFAPGVRCDVRMKCDTRGCKRSPVGVHRTERVQACKLHIVNNSTWRRFDGK